MAFTFCVKLYDNIYIKIYVKNIMMIIIITIMIRGDACMTLTLKEGGGGRGFKAKIICYRTYGVG